MELAWTCMHREDARLDMKVACGCSTQHAIPAELVSGVSDCMACSQDSTPLAGE